MERARLFRTPLASRLTPSEALRALRDDRRPFALVGAWASSRAVLGSEPLRSFAGDPFEALDDLPVVGEGASPPDSSASPAGVFGGWFGWLGFGLGGVVEDLPPAPRR